MATLDVAFFPKLNAGLGNESAACSLSGATGLRLSIPASTPTPLPVPNNTAVIRLECDADFTIADEGDAGAPGATAGASIPHKGGQQYFLAGVQNRTVSVWSAT